jgi:hypothetical protein
VLYARAKVLAGMKKIPLIVVRLHDVLLRDYGVEVKRAIRKKKNKKSDPRCGLSRETALTMLREPERDTFRTDELGAAPVPPRRVIVKRLVKL